ncbi:membrane-associated guanylate kinase, WW and PDZ domain-containing protein 3 [Clarias gariepinus]|uniref:membrane-associated guanylate kinase, WW and PDZ domain-containing protein 2 n=1 Tax=Clarias gariepinus TaxID=13013 RepID=UPI00234C3CF9|nr:membrane-associated guanylate kinase, WW and PDZ domain-containing protein 2 [Clarias gariepinus]
MYIDAFKRLLSQRLNCLRRTCVCRRQCGSIAMAKVVVKKLHWRSKVQESFVPLLGSSGELGVAIGGGADYGEFPFVTAAPGGGITVGDIILEIGGTPVLGMTLGDVRGVLNSCPHPVRIKTVTPDLTLCKDLRLYLSKCFTPGCMDSQLQQVIRENLYLRAVPCTTRQPRDGEISGVDYNFVSVEEFFSLEESGALLESGKFKGNYYGTPRPIHIGPDSPPITYQEHRKLLRNFRTRSKSLSNLEKAVEEGYNSEGDSGLSGGSGGASSVPAPTSSPSQSRDSSGGDGSAFENGSRHRRGQERAGLETWEMTYSDSGEPYYADHQPKPAYWQGRRALSRESVFMTELGEFTDQPSELRGYSIHTRVCKGPQGFGFNITGGSRPREFLQIYSIIPGGPSTLNTGDILMYINDTCVLGTSYKEVVEMLKIVPVGQSVDMVVRRGYPLLYDPDGSPRLSRETASHRSPLPTITQPKAQALLPQSPAVLNNSGLMYSAEAGYPRAYERRASRFSLDANGNSSHYSPPPRAPSSSRHSSEGESDILRPQHSQRRIRQLQSTTLASQSDSEVVSAIGSHRASFIRNHNNNSPYPPSPSRFYSTKSSESDLSSYAPSPPLSRLPLPQTESGHASASSSPGGVRRYSHFQNGPRPLLTPPTSVHSDGPYFTFNSANSSNPSSTVLSPGRMSNGGDRELVPIALAKCKQDGSLGFSLMAGEHGGRTAVVKRVWDWQQCNSLQPGDAIMKINGADVQNLNFIQVHRILEEHTKSGEVILLVQRRGAVYSSVSPKPRRQHSPILPRPASASQIPLTHTPPLLRKSLTPPPQSLVRSSLVQSTSFLDAVPVTLTLEPRDWMSSEEGGTTLNPRLKTEEKSRPPVPQGFEVELKRRPGEGFGFVIASQDMENGRAASLLPHRFVTVRRGSPAARSGLIRPGDRLESVEGRSVVNVPHRELAQILRRAGNTLRLTVVPRSSAHSSEHTESDPHHKSRKPHRSKPKDTSRYYSVELERGSTGFGFSLRGGSEYNMDLYVLGLMEGGPASSSHKMQVSDQLVEINGHSTAGMSHSQAVEQIRTSGHKIHLVLKKGNGYVPDYGHDEGAALSSLPSALQPHLAAVNHHHHRLKSTSSPPRTGRAPGQIKGTEHMGWEENSKQTQVTSHRSKDRRRRRRLSSHSLPRNMHESHSDGDDISEPAPRGRHRQRETKGYTERRSKSEERRRQPNEREEETQGEEKQQERERERKSMGVSNPNQKYAEISQKRNEEEEVKLERKEWGEVENSNNLTGGKHKDGRDGPELAGQSKSKREQILTNILGKERSRRWEVDTRSYVGMHLPRKEQIHSSHLSAHQSPFSFLISQHTEPESQVTATNASGSAASVPKFSNYERYRSEAISSIAPDPWFKSGLHTLSREIERNRLTGKEKEQAVRENSIT